LKTAVGEAPLLYVYGRRYVARKRRKPDIQGFKVLDTRLYSRYKGFIAAYGEAGVVRDEHETPEEYARKAAEELGEPRVARLGDIYLYARFRNAIPAERLKDASRTRG